MIHNCHSDGSIELKDLESNDVKSADSRSPEDRSKEIVCIDVANENDDGEVSDLSSAGPFFKHVVEGMAEQRQPFTCSSDSGEDNCELDDEEEAKHTIRIDGLESSTTYYIRDSDDGSS